jgi:sugar phosphate isomerase/epimerase
MILGYNTNGLAHHDPDEAIELLAEIGYRSVAITIDHQWLNPRESDVQVAAMAGRLDACNMTCVLETGARFLLDPRRKHWPSLVEPRETAAPRIDLIQYAIRQAKKLGANCVSIWSGSKSPEMPVQTALDHLAANLEVILQTAESHGVDIGFEPEPGMFIDTMSQFSRLMKWVQHPRLKLTVDIGHLFCQGEVPLVDYIQRWADQTVNIHIEDMRAGVHEHLMFGDGEIHFPPVIKALRESKYAGPLHVELSRHSHDAANIARRSFEFLSDLIRIEEPRI